ncbi:MAG: hypothetical protein HKN08_08165 [Gammaproteobacteria bacterium]|nr:hypothetical protein [Gammaproteobacteria bacterium]
MSWGHPVTTGIPNIDYYLSSSLLEPDSPEGHYTETLVQLKLLPTYFYPPPYISRPFNRETLGLPDDATLYVCPQSLFKLHPDFDIVFEKILTRDEKGVLVLINYKDNLDMEIVKNRIQEKFPAIIEKIIFLPKMTRVIYLNLLKASDALLDPPYFGGGNTTYEAFSQDIPIVTMPGEFMRGRVTLGCYKMMGIYDLIAEDIDSYVSLAYRLANDKEWNSQLKFKIKEKKTVLFENPEVVHEMERFFISARKSVLSGEKIKNWNYLR